jgi:predicted component of type VI protein secretion system
MSQTSAINLRLFLKDQPILSYRFDKGQILVGRSPGSDIYVDNPGVSREHCRFERTPEGGYRVVDLESANGTFVNGERVQTSAVRSNDVVQFGKYSISVTVEQGQPEADPNEGRPPSRARDGATVVLSPAEVRRLMSDTPPPAAGTGALKVQPDPQPVARHHPIAAPSPRPHAAPASVPRPQTLRLPVDEPQRSSPVMPVVIGIVLATLVGFAVWWMTSR